MTPRELHDVKLAEKKALRQKMLAFRKGLTKEQHEAKSRAILARLYDEPRFQQAKTIFAYASMPDEVQLYDLLAHALRGASASACRSSRARGSWKPSTCRRLRRSCRASSAS